MKTKYHKIILAYLTLSILFTACKKQLNLQPSDSIDATAALHTPDDISSAVVGTYSLLGDGACYGNNFNMVSELLAGDNYCTYVGTYSTFQDINSKTMNANSADAERSWLTPYKAINLTNNILANIDKVTNADTKAELEGQAYFVRGILYFELVRFYALPYEQGKTNSQLGVPIMLEAVSTSAQAFKYAKRNTVDEVYAQIIKDLTKAQDLLGESAVNFRATKYTAKALLSRVYLQMGDYPNALAMADDVIQNSGRSLNASVTESFTNRNSNESLFEIQQNDQNNAGTSSDGLATFYSGQIDADGNLTIGNGDITLDESFVDGFDKADNRKNQLIYTGYADKYYTGKWKAYGQNIPVIRLAEMYLTRAECNIRLGSITGDLPLNDINKIRQRSKASVLVLPPTLDQILLERQLELCFEGSRIHDLRRTKRATGAFAYNSPKLVLPIPYREMNANKELVQNPGY